MEEPRVATALGFFLGKLCAFFFELPAAFSHGLPSLH